MRFLGLSFFVLSGLSTVFAVPFDAPASLFAWAGQLHHNDGLFTSQGAKHSSSLRAKDNDGGREGTILDRLRDDERFTKVVELVERNRGLRDDLENTERRVTFFAPTNEAFEKTKKMFEGQRGRGGGRDDDGGRKRRRPSEEEIVRYHIAREEIRSDDLHRGALIDTRLKLDDLDGENQKIKVFRFREEPVLNMYVRVEEADIETDNGILHVIDRVLVPPPRIDDTMSLFPTHFSTFLWALRRTGLDRELDERAITVFAPTNNAWEELGIHRLFHLFSDAGRDDLKQICQYHIGTDLVYSNRLLEEERVSVRTILKGEELEIKSRRRSEGSGGRRDDDDDDERAFKRRRGGGGRGHEDERDPSQYLLSVNNEAQITVEDGLAENGVIHAIGNVLIPRNVHLRD